MSTNALPVDKRVMALCRCTACGAFAADAYREIQFLHRAAAGTDRKAAAEAAMLRWLETLAPKARSFALEQAVQRVWWRLDGEFP